MFKKFKMWLGFAVLSGLISSACPVHAKPFRSISEDSGKSSQDSKCGYINCGKNFNTAKRCLSSELKKPKYLDYINSLGGVKKRSSMERLSRDDLGKETGNLQKLDARQNLQSYSESRSSTIEHPYCLKATCKYACNAKDCANDRERVLFCKQVCKVQSIKNCLKAYDNAQIDMKTALQEGPDNQTSKRRSIESSPEATNAKRRSVEVGPKTTDKRQSFDHSLIDLNNIPEEDEQPLSSSEKKVTFHNKVEKFVPKTPDYEYEKEEDED